jgi:hypothetical protein
MRRRFWSARIFHFSAVIYAIGFFFAFFGGRLVQALHRFHGLFYGRGKFCCKSAQFCVTRRKPHSLGSPMIRNAVQHCENPCNTLGLNYKPAALNQLSYAGVPTRKLFSAS